MPAPVPAPSGAQHATPDLTSAQQKHADEAKSYLSSLMPQLQTSLTQLASLPASQRAKDPMAALALSLLEQSKLTKDSKILALLTEYVYQQPTPSSASLNSSVKQTSATSSLSSSAAAQPQAQTPADAKTATKAPAAAAPAPAPAHAPTTDTKTDKHSDSAATTAGAHAQPSAQPLRLILCGAACSGKGTQAELIKSDWPKIVHISTGDLLRDEVKKESKLGLEAKTYMESGRLVPDQLLIQLVVDLVSHSAACKEHGFMLDGFPRTAAQSHALREAKIEPQVVVVLQVPDAELVTRVTGRRLDPVTGRIYHIKNDMPTDPAIVARLTQRSDDSEAQLKTRLESFHAAIGDISQFYKDKVVQIDGNAPKTQVYEKVKARLLQAQQQAK